MSKRSAIHPLKTLFRVAQFLGQHTCRQCGVSREVCVYVCACTCVYMCVYCMRVHIVCVYACMYICMCMYVHVFVYRYTHTCVRKLTQCRICAGQRLTLRSFITFLSYCFVTEALLEPGAPLSWLDGLASWPLGSACLGPPVPRTSSLLLRCWEEAA